MVGADNMHSAIAFLAPRDPGYVLDVSGAGILASSTHKAAAQAFLSFIVSRRARRSSPTRTATSTRSAQGSPRRNR